MEKKDKKPGKMLMLTLTAVARMPLWMLYGFSTAIRPVLQYIVKYRRKVIDENLESSFPELDKKEIKKIRTEYYRHLADMMVETVKLLHISDKEMARRMEIVGVDLVNRSVEEGQSVILFLGHYCNWEWVTEMTQSFTDKGRAAYIYKPLRDPGSERVYKRLRGHFKRAEGIPQDETARTLLRWHLAGDKFIAGFIADHRANSAISPMHADFLNHSTPYTVVAEALGRKVGATFIYCDVEKLKRGRYRLTFKQMTGIDDGNPDPMTRAYFAMLEQTIKRQPAYWLWSHRRWLYK